MNYQSRPLLILSFINAIYHNHLPLLISCPLPPRLLPSRSHHQLPLLLRWITSDYSPDFHFRASDFFSTSSFICLPKIPSDCNCLHLSFLLFPFSHFVHKYQTMIFFQFACSPAFLTMVWSAVGSGFYLVRKINEKAPSTCEAATYIFWMHLSTCNDASYNNFAYFSLQSQCSDFLFGKVEWIKIKNN